MTSTSKPPHTSSLHQNFVQIIATAGLAVSLVTQILKANILCSLVFPELHMAALHATWADPIHYLDLDFSQLLRLLDFAAHFGGFCSRNKIRLRSRSPACWLFEAPIAPNEVMNWTKAWGVSPVWLDIEPSIRYQTCLTHLNGEAKQHYP